MAARHTPCGVVWMEMPQLLGPSYQVILPSKRRRILLANCPQEAECVNSQVMPCNTVPSGWPLYQCSGSSIKPYKGHDSTCTTHAGKVTYKHDTCSRSIEHRVHCSENGSCRQHTKSEDCSIPQSVLEPSTTESNYLHTCLYLRMRLSSLMVY